jgi:hypothetical protein
MLVTENQLLMMQELNLKHDGNNSRSGDGGYKNLIKKSRGQWEE